MIGMIKDHGAQEAKPVSAEDVKRIEDAIAAFNPEAKEKLAAKASK
ncbi:hypothetical protein PsyrH_14485 [Pseudomonas syringae pv. syringae HS191]|nr:hypothetical protein PsyrH_14485 [Pseudomonas syringae pv. syringae HS191]RML67695.1 hypothetical protein ALQ91_200062 [Pseudomonas syringae pv. syringae]